MSESLIIFSREWLVTTSLTAYLVPVYFRPVTSVYDMTELTRYLRTQPRSPVVLGLRPHEHVTDLYRLQPLLAGRAGGAVCEPQLLLDGLQPAGMAGAGAVRVLFLGHHT